jgi:hypothetical protein
MLNRTLCINYRTHTGRRQLYGYLNSQSGAGTYAFFTGSTLRVEPESSDLILKIVSFSVRVANLTIPSGRAAGGTGGRSSEMAHIRLVACPTAC